MTQNGKDPGEELLSLSEEIIQQCQVLFLRLRNLSEELNEQDYLYYTTQFEHIQELFDRFSQELRAAGFPSGDALQKAKEKLSQCYDQFFKLRTGFFNQYASHEADRERTQEEPEDLPEDAPEESQEEISEEPAEEEIDGSIPDDENGEKKKKTKRKVRKPRIYSPEEQARQQSQQEAAAFLGIPIQPGQPVTEADLRNAQLQLDEERRRQEASAAEEVRLEKERLQAYNRQMEESVKFEHLESSHIDMSREGIGHKSSAQSSPENVPQQSVPDNNQDAKKIVTAAAASAAVVSATATTARKAERDRGYQEWLEQRGRSALPDADRSASPSPAGAAASEKAPRRYKLSRITTNLGAVSYVAFSAAAQKAAQEVSKDNDTVSAMLTASYYVPTAVGMTRAIVQKPTRSLEKSVKRITSAELGEYSSSTIRRHKELKAQIAAVQKQLSGLSPASGAPADKLTLRRRKQLQEQLTSLRSQLRPLEKEAAQCRRIQQFRHEKELEKQLLEQLKVKGKVPRGAKPIHELSQNILRDENRKLAKKYGELSQLPGKTIHTRIQRLTSEGKAVKLQIRQLESKGSALSSAERQLLKKLKAKSKATGEEIAKLTSLSHARSDLAFKESHLRRIMKISNRRHLYKLNGMRLMRSFAMRPLYSGQDSNTEGLAHFVQFAADPTTRQLTKRAVTLPFRATGKVVRLVAPKFSYRVDTFKQAAAKKIHHVVTTPERVIRSAVKGAAAAINNAVPNGIKTALATPYQYLHRKYDDVLTGVLNIKKWFADTRLGRGLTRLRMFRRNASVLLRAAGAFLKKAAVYAIGIYAAVVLLIACAGGILGVISGAASSMILAPDTTATGKINLAPYCRILSAETSRFNSEISALRAKYQDEEVYESLTVNYSGPANNIKEILSMMAVRLQQNIDIGTNPEVETYLTSVFRDSHTYTVYEHEYTCAGCKEKLVQETIIDPATGAATIQPKIEKYCPGHIDVTVTVTVLDFDEIFSADTYHYAGDGWEGWTEANRTWCMTIYEMDWNELYEGFSLGLSGGSASGYASANEVLIWNYLLDLVGNPYGVAGLMGNLWAESNLSSINLQDGYESVSGFTDESYTQAVDAGSYTNFTSDRYGYGLAQWTDPSRKANLLTFARNRGTSIGDLDMQLDFLARELNGGSVMAALQGAASVKEASDTVLTRFENPADQSDSVKQTRAERGQYYYDLFGGRRAEELTEMQKKVVEIAMNSADYGIAANAGYCQAWAAYVYAKAGLPIDNSSCARVSGERYGVSDDWSTIPAGAAVYGYSSSQYGHVGIYVGYGLVYHNIGGVAVDTLEDWVRYYNGFCWGWEAGSDLTQYD